MFKLIYVLTGLLSSAVPVGDPSTTALHHTAFALNAGHGPLFPTLVIPDRYGLHGNLLDVTSNATAVASFPVVNASARAIPSSTHSSTPAQDDDQYTVGTPPLRCVGYAKMSINRIEGDSCLANDVTSQTLVGFQRLCYGWRRVETPTVHDPLSLYRRERHTETDTEWPLRLVVSPVDPRTTKFVSHDVDLARLAISNVFGTIVIAFYAFIASLYMFIAMGQHKAGRMAQITSQETRITSCADTDAGEGSPLVHSPLLTLAIVATMQRVIVVLRRLSRTISSLRSTVDAQRKEIERLESHVKAQKIDADERVKAIKAQSGAATQQREMDHRQELMALKAIINNGGEENDRLTSQCQIDRGRIGVLNDVIDNLNQTVRLYESRVVVEQPSPSIEDELQHLRQWKEKAEARQTREIQKLEGELREAKDAQERAEAKATTEIGLKDEEINKLRLSKEALVNDHAREYRLFRNQVAGARRELSHVEGKLSAATSKIATQTAQLVMQDGLIASKDARLAKAMEDIDQLATTVQRLELTVADTRDESCAKIADLQAELQKVLARPSEPEVKLARVASGQGEQGRRGAPRSILGSALRDIKQQRPAPASLMEE
ncbi:hypothetical protein FRB94_010959 [Tulasnella sp. JGI-2019a]|nr:hypothetical protein FRB94_010959 [Tulasnella sp. JGI-2019a]KAG9027846.1 hypothetical protein FRB95_007327 [Tulasnella sp. JGI-2019a]